MKSELVENISKEERVLGSAANILKSIKDYIEKLASEKFTGEVIFRLRFNQGGIRESKITLEKSL